MADTTTLLSRPVDLFYFLYFLVRIVSLAFLVSCIYAAKFGPESRRRVSLDRLSISLPALVVTGSHSKTSSVLCSNVGRPAHRGCDGIPRKQQPSHLVQVIPMPRGVRDHHLARRVHEKPSLSFFYLKKNRFFQFPVFILGMRGLWKSVARNITSHFMF